MCRILLLYRVAAIAGSTVFETNIRPLLKKLVFAKTEKFIKMFKSINFIHDLAKL